MLNEKQSRREPSALPRVLLKEASSSSMEAWVIVDGSVASQLPGTPKALFTQIYEGRSSALASAASAKRAQVRRRIVVESIGIKGAKEKKRDFASGLLCVPPLPPASTRFHRFHPLPPASTRISLAIHKID